MSAQDDSEYNDMELQELEELVYALQIDYDPPLTEDDRKRVVDEIMKLKDQGYEENQVIEKWRSKRKGMGRSCFNGKTVVDNKDVDLVSDDQMVFMEDKNKSGSINYCFDRYSDVNHVLETGKNPFNKKPLGEKQISSLEYQYKNSKYPNIFVDEFPEEFESRMKGKHKTYIEPAYKKKGRILEEMFKSVGEGYLAVDQFSTELEEEDYNFFLMHKGIKQKVSEGNDRNQVASEALNYIILYIKSKESVNIQVGNSAKIEMSGAIKEFVTMKRENLSYEELIEKEGKDYQGNGIKELLWKPDFMVEEYYDDGSIMERYYVNNKEEYHGKYNKWHENGNLSKEYNYINGTAEGEFKRWYENGSIEKISFYISGTKNGTESEWYENGNLKVETFFEDGLFQGELKKWYENGNLNQILRYDKGIPNGKIKKFYESGRIKNIDNYVNGNQQGDFTEWYENGNLKFTGIIEDNKNIGEHKYFYPNGKLSKFIFYTNMENYKTFQYNEDGYENAVFEIKNNKYIYSNYLKNNDFIEKFYDNGTIKEIISYKLLKGEKQKVLHKKFGLDGYLVEVLEWYISGKPKSRQNLDKHSLVKWYQNGNKIMERIANNLEAKSLFENGEPFIFEKLNNNGDRNGKYEITDEYGDLIFKCFYKDGKFIVDKKQSNNVKIKYYDKDKISIKSRTEILEDGTKQIVTWGYNGNLQKILNDKDGVKNGVFLSFYENGNPKSLSEYTNDEPIIDDREWYDNQMPKLAFYEKTTPEDQILSKEVKYFESGEINTSTVYFEDIKISEEIFYDNSQLRVLKSEDNFENGNLKGEVKYYNENGDLIIIENYKNGKLNGNVTVYNKEVIILEVEFKDGYLNGFHREYCYPSGKLSFEGEYFMGKQNGVFTRFPCQDKISNTQFSMGKRIDSGNDITPPSPDFEVFDYYYYKSNI